MPHRRPDPGGQPRDEGDRADLGRRRTRSPTPSNVADWDGRTATAKRPPTATTSSRSGAAGAAVETTDDSSSATTCFRFPLDSGHTYGDGFGAGRGHQGQDVLTKCGATDPRRARRPGADRTTCHSAAGNYLVIDGKRTRLDFITRTWSPRSPLREGARVRTGQLIGHVGQTGNASGCHLHFEVWSAPGWYEGGHPLPSVGAAENLGLLELNRRAERGAPRGGDRRGRVARGGRGREPRRPTGAGFELRSAQVRPEPPTSTARASAASRSAPSAALDLVVRVVRVADGETVRRRVEHGLAPGSAPPAAGTAVATTAALPATARTSSGSVHSDIAAPPRAGSSSTTTSSRSPAAHLRRSVRRSAHGGRVHEGQDLPAACGTPLLAARGGRVQARGFSDALYGNYVLIDGPATSPTISTPTSIAPTPLSARRPGPYRRADRRGREDRKRALRVLPAALRALAARLPRREPGTRPAAAGLGRFLLEHRCLRRRLRTGSLPRVIGTARPRRPAITAAQRGC